MREETVNNNFELTTLTKHKIMSIVKEIFLIKGLIKIRKQREIFVSILSNVNVTTKTGFIKTSPFQTVGPFKETLPKKRAM